jgi:hypothetical protein
MAGVEHGTLAAEQVVVRLDRTCLGMEVKPIGRGEPLS